MHTSSEGPGSSDIDPETYETWLGYMRRLKEINGLLSVGPSDSLANEGQDAISDWRFMRPEVRDHLNYASDCVAGDYLIEEFTKLVSITVEEAIEKHFNTTTPKDTTSSESAPDKRKNVFDKLW